MRNDRIKPRDGERIDPDTCPDCFHLFEECCCEEFLDGNPSDYGDGSPECSSAHTEPNSQQGQTTLLSGDQLRKRVGGCDSPVGEPNETSAAIAIFHRGDCDSNGPATLQTLNSHTAQNSFDELCEWFDSLPKPPEPLPWGVPQEKATDRHPFA